MAYATQQDMIDRFGEDHLIQVTSDAGEALDAVAVDRALLDASAVIDGYLQARYRLPLADPPALLRIHACNIAMYQLLVLRPLGDVDDARKRYDDAVSFLTRVAEGKVSIGPTDDGAPAPEHGAPRLAGPVRVFGRHTLTGF